ncbi:MAG TPA: GDSL-type esterase/lipase family protein [Phycisphaerae bacterium]|nr:GDSL-type esterase/lipase family protein [Phycisphaerae bacterium]
MDAVTEVVPVARKGGGKWRRRMVRGLVGVAAAGVVVEMGLRVVFGLGSPLLYEADAECGYCVRPDQHIRRFFAENSINHEGMRSGEITERPAAGTKRVLFIGDSVTYALTYVDQSKIWTSRLPGLLAEAQDGRVEVLNASAGGWSPANEVGFLKSRGTFHADVVCIVANSGDLGEELARLPAEGTEGFPTHRPWTAIGETWSRYVEPRLMGHVISDPGTSEPSAAELAERTQANLELYGEAQAFCDGHGAKMGLVYIPFPGWTKEQIEGAEKTLGEWAGEHGVPFVDVTKRYCGEALGKISKDGFHPTAYGDEVIAEEVARQWGVIDGAMGGAGKEAGAATEHAR